MNKVKQCAVLEADTDLRLKDIHDSHLELSDADALRTSLKGLYEGLITCFFFFVTALFCSYLWDSPVPSTGSFIVLFFIYFTVFIMS